MKNNSKEKDYNKNTIINNININLNNNNNKHTSNNTTQKVNNIFQISSNNHKKNNNKNLINIIYDDEIIELINNISNEIVSYLQKIQHSFKEILKNNSNFKNNSNTIKSIINELMPIIAEDKTKELNEKINYYSSLNNLSEKEIKKCNVDTIKFFENEKLYFKKLKVKIHEKVNNFNELIQKEQLIIKYVNKDNNNKINNINESINDKLFQTDGNFNSTKMKPLNLINNSEANNLININNTDYDNKDVELSLFLAKKIINFFNEMSELQNCLIKKDITINLKKKKFEVTKYNLKKLAEDIFKNYKNPNNTNNINNVTEDTNCKNNTENNNKEINSIKANDDTFTKLKDELGKLMTENNKLNEEIKTFNEILANKNNEVSSLKESNEQNNNVNKNLIDNLEKENKELKAEIIRVKEENKNQTENIEKIMKSNEDNINKIKLEEENKNKLQTIINNNKQKIKNLSDQLLKLQNLLLSNENENKKKLEKEIDDNQSLQKEIINLKNQNEKLQNVNKELNDISINKKNHYESLLQSALTNQNNFDKEKQDIILSYNEQIKNNLNKIDELNKKNNQQSDLINQLKESNCNFENNIKDINNKLKHQIEINEIHNKQITNLKIQIKTKTENINLINKNLTKKNNEFNLLNSKFIQLNNDYESINKENEDLKENNLLLTMENQIYKEQKNKLILNNNIQPEQFDIISEKNFKSFKWYLLKNKLPANNNTTISDQYDNYLWIGANKINISKFNFAFKKESDKLEEFQKLFEEKLEEKQKIIDNLSKLIKTKQNESITLNSNGVLQIENNIKELSMDKSDLIIKNQYNNKTKISEFSNTTNLLARLNTQSGGTYVKEGLNKTENDLIPIEQYNSILKKLNESQEKIIILKKEYKEAIQLEDNCSFIQEKNNTSDFLDDYGKEAMNDISEDETIKIKKSELEYLNNKISNLKEDLDNSSNQLDFFKKLYKEQSIKINNIANDVRLLLNNIINNNISNNNDTILSLCTLLEIPSKSFIKENEDCIQKNKEK